MTLFSKEDGLHRKTFERRFSHALPATKLTFANSPDALTSLDEIEAVITPIRPWIDDLAVRASDLKWIHFLSAGVDEIWDYTFDKEKFIVTKSSGVHAIPIAEYVIGGLLYFLKGFDVFVRNRQSRIWRGHTLQECTGKTMAILGLGAIGKEVAKRAKHMGMYIVGMATKGRNVAHVDEVYEPGNIREMLQTSDFVVVCLPLTPFTKGFISEDVLNSMKHGAYIVNISRGSVVDEKAMIRLLESGQLKGAVLDVFEKEPLPESSPLWSLPNVLITPHVSGSNPLYMDRVIDIFLDNRDALLHNKPLPTGINLKGMY